MFLGLNIMDDLAMAGGGVRPSGSSGCEQPTNHETPTDVKVCFRQYLFS